MDSVALIQPKIHVIAVDNQSTDTTLSIFGGV
ncbi:hypothetical protein EB093_09730 [bacterium]|nr:hypothetical protein [bacterium]